MFKQPLGTHLRQTLDLSWPRLPFASGTSPICCTTQCLISFVGTPHCVANSGSRNLCQHACFSRAVCLAGRCLVCHDCILELCPVHHDRCLYADFRTLTLTRVFAHSPTVSQSAGRFQSSSHCVNNNNNNNNTNNNANYNNKNKSKNPKREGRGEGR